MKPFFLPDFLEFAVLTAPDPYRYQYNQDYHHDHPYYWQTRCHDAVLSLHDFH
jgi:hypothetical protein